MPVGARTLLAVGLAAALAAPSAVVAAPLPAPDTVLGVDAGAGSANGHQLTEYRPPETTIGGSWHTERSGEDTLTLGAWNQSTSVSLQFYAGYGQAIQLGHTYTNVATWWNRAAANPGASCDQATVTVWELARDAVEAVTTLAMDMWCPQSSTLYQLRMNSSHGYAWLTDTSVQMPSLYPGETADVSWILTAHGTSSVSIPTFGLRYGEPAITITSQTCAGVTLAPGATCTAWLHYAPTSPGWANGLLAIGTSLQPAVWYRGIEGIVKDPLTVTPSSLPLGSTPATVSTPPGQVTVGFAGPGSGRVVGISFTGLEATRFAVSGNGCDAVVLADGQSCSFGVTAKPTAVGPISGTLVVDLGAAEGTRQIALTASGADPVSITPSVTLPTIRPGTTATAVVTVSSLATLPLPVTSVDLVGNPADVFAITSNGCAGGVPAAGSCDVEVTYTAPLSTPINGTDTHSTVVSVTGPGLLGTRTSQVMASAALPSLGATWTVKSSLGRRWNFGNGLARSVNGTTTTLVQVTSSDRVGSSPVKDAGPRMPVYLNRSTNGGATWASTVRVNATTQHGIWPAVAASGRYVAVAWASASKVVAFRSTAPRALYVRVSRNAGNGSWGAIHRVSSSTGRIDHPSIAMSGTLVVVGYTDSVTGSVKAAISRDRGSSWRTVSLGTTNVAASWGRTGLISVAASGSTVVIAWVSSFNSTTKLRISTNSGRTWGGPASFAGGQDRPGVAIAGSRIALAWLDGSLNVRVRTAGAWGPENVVPVGYGMDDSGNWTSYSVYGPSIALYGTAGVATTVSGEYGYCGGCDHGSGADLVWSESSTNGATWAAPDRVLRPDYTYLYNDDASVVWVSPTKRIVLVNAWGYGSKTSLVWGATQALAPAAAQQAPRVVMSGSTDTGASSPPAGFSGPWGASAGGP